MIPVGEQPEPASFDAKVRKPGQDFLHHHPSPIKKQWKKAQYWRDVIPDLHTAYKGICAYCAEWIPPSTGEATVDHFIPKSMTPKLAYEWSNFRLAASRYNMLKQEATDVLDPFTLKSDWFTLHFPSLQVKPNGTLSQEDAEKVWKSIDRLRLNDDRSIKSRQRWLSDYCQGYYGLDYLKRSAPFIAYELERQGLQDAIKPFYRVPGQAVAAQP